MENIDSYVARGLIESKEQWRKIIDDIPSIKFKSSWEVKIIPPFGGAVARFLIEKNKKIVCSIYLDFYDKLGCCGEPYYELYPFEDDVKRYLLNETDELIKDIDKLFKKA